MSDGTQAAVRYPVAGMRATPDLAEMLTAVEGCILYAYDDKDPACRFIQPGDPVKGTLTIGHGRTGPDVKPGMRITQAEADAFLLEDIREHEASVKRYVKVPLTQGEYNAMTSIFYNVGPGRRPGTNGADDPGKNGIGFLGREPGLPPSTLLLKLNSGDYEGAFNSFTSWRMPGTPLEKGLLKRRLVEILVAKDLPWKRFLNAYTGLGYTLGMALRKAQEEFDDLQALKPHPLPTPSQPPKFEPDYPKRSKPEPTVTVIEDVPAPKPLDLDIPPPEPPKVETDLTHVEEVLFEQDTAPSVSSPGAVEETQGHPTDLEPVPAPPTLEKPKPKPAPTLETIARDAGIDLAALKKGLTAALLWFGHTLRSLTANGIKIAGIGGSTLAVFLDQLRFPWVQVTIVMCGVIGILFVVWIGGLIAEKLGLRVKKQIEKKEFAS